MVSQSGLCPGAQPQDEFLQTKIKKDRTVKPNCWGGAAYTKDSLADIKYCCNIIQIS